MISTEKEHSAGDIVKVEEPIEIREGDLNGDLKNDI